MKKPNKKTMYAVSLVTFLAVAVLLVTALSSDRPKPENRDHVTATIFPIFDIARTVGQDAVTVELLLPPGAEPHTFEPAPSDAVKLLNSSVLYAVGQGLDNWAGRLSDAADTPIVTVSEGIALIPADGNDHEEAGHDDEHEEEGHHEHGDGYDPHYWLNAGNALIIAENIAADLSARYPDKAEVFLTNLANYRESLLDTDRKVREILSGIDDRNISTFHGAFKYYAQAYDLSITAEFEPYPGRDPSARYLSELASTLKSSKTTTLYSEPNFNAQAIEVFAKDNGLKLGQLDPLGGAPGRDSLIKTLLYNANEIHRNQ